MTACDLIVFESLGRWATALQVAASRRLDFDAGNITIRQVRSLAELTSSLDQRPTGFVVVEVRRNNLQELLTWLVLARTSYHGARFVAAIAEADFRRDECALAADALRAAGAVDVARSPRSLQHLLDIGRRHCEAAKILECPSKIGSFTEWAFGLLPWQDATRPIS